MVSLAGLCDVSRAVHSVYDVIVREVNLRVSGKGASIQSGRGVLRRRGSCFK